MEISLNYVEKLKKNYDIDVIEHRWGAVKYRIARKIGDDFNSYDDFIRNGKFSTYKSSKKGENIKP